jgi:tetratricopeptide (TPR) repeat protein
MWLFVFLLIAGGAQALLWSRSSTRRRATHGALVNRMDTIERLILEESWDDVRTHLNETAGAMSRLKGPASLDLRVRRHHAFAGFLAQVGQHDAARNAVAAADAELERAPDPALDPLRVKSDAHATLVALRADGLGASAQRCRRALARAEQVRDPATLLALAIAALGIGQVLHRRGDWDGAREMLRSTLRLAGRIGDPTPAAGAWSREAREVFAARGRVAGSTAAVHLGEVYASIGDRERAERAFDRAESMLRQGTTPSERWARSRALLVRATHEPSDLIEGEGGRSARLERAIAEGLSSGLPPGRVLAGRAEVTLARTFASLGARDKAIERLRRAVEHVHETPSPDARACAMEALLTLGLALNAEGRVDEAVEAFEQALARGKDDPEPEIRHPAAIAAYHLHPIRLQRGDVEAARKLLDTLESIIPALAPDVRPVFAGMSLRCRGMQLYREGQLDQALDSLACAEARGRQIEGPFGSGWRGTRRSTSGTSRSRADATTRPSSITGARSPLRRCSTRPAPSSRIAPIWNCGWGRTCCASIASARRRSS